MEDGIFGGTGREWGSGSMNNLYFNGDLLLLWLFCFLFLYIWYKHRVFFSVYKTKRLSLRIGLCAYRPLVAQRMVVLGELVALKL